MSASTHVEHTYRKEIDGLRALAVVSVILFHADFHWFSGGFVGVDVFFVISGYLITSNILAEKAAGRFSLGSFYERRARRILPALFFVVLVCGVPAWLWMSPGPLRDYAQSVLAVSVFASNILFSREQGGYFAGASEEKPLLHTWSLGVEEQFYVMFPLFVVLVWVFGRRWLVGSIVVIAILSLGISEWGWRNQPDVNFYSTPARVWELLVGALMAFASFTGPLYERVSWITRQILSAAGCALVLFAIFAYDGDTPFPSVYALLPTIGTALIVGFGSSSTYVGKILSLNAVVGVGLISYSAYLWHQPLFAFARIRSLNEPNQVIFGSLIIGTFVLAYFTWRYVEQPFRDRRNFSRRVVFSTAAIGTAAFIVVGLLGHFTPILQRAAVPTSMLSTFGNVGGFKGCFDVSVEQIQGDQLFCHIGSANVAKGSFLIVGDSHARALAPAFDVVGKKIHVAGLFAAVPSCAPLLGVYFVSSDYQVRRQKCELFNRKIFNFVRNNHVSHIILIAKWAGYTNEVLKNGRRQMNYISRTADGVQSIAESRIAFQEGFARTIRAYNSIGTRVHVVEQVPFQRYDAEKIYYRSILENKTDEVYDYAIDVDEHRAFQSFAHSVMERSRAQSDFTLINLEKAFCDTRKCKLGSADGGFYSDKHHLSSFGIEQVIPLIDDFLSKNIT